jgi:hypothetical protein
MEKGLGEGMWRGVCLTLVLLVNGVGLGRMSRSILIRYPFFFQMVRDVFRVCIYVFKLMI